LSTLNKRRFKSTLKGEFEKKTNDWEIFFFARTKKKKNPIFALTKNIFKSTIKKQLEFIIIGISG
jgi:hypothetical protein